MLPNKGNSEDKQTGPSSCWIKRTPNQSNHKRTTRRTYTAVELSERRELIHQVSVLGVQIRSAAKELGIKYEAAKHIIQDYRRTGKVEPLRLRKRKKKYACLAWISKELANKRLVDDPDAESKLADFEALSSK